MAHKVIKLNANWEPMEIISWFDAFLLCYLEPYKATVLWTYPGEAKIRSQAETWDYPAIIALKGHKKRRPKRIHRPSLKAILARDMYTCQYCGAMLTTQTGTRDHVIPQAKGGTWDWNNLVACCRVCQDKKQDSLPAECGMYPVEHPTEPQFHTRFRTAIIQASQPERSVWKVGFKSLGMENLL